MAKLTKEEIAAQAQLMKDFDNLFGYELLAGVDEAGRGPLAGPVFAASVILPKDFHHPLLNDSKKMTEKLFFLPTAITLKPLTFILMKQRLF